jgi:hypothetical protein
VAELPSGGQGSWRASFAWKGRPLTVEAAELEVGRDLVVPLPAPRPQRSRFARTEASDADSAPSTHADQEEPSVAEGRDQPTESSMSAAAVDPNDPLALQEALIDAREEAELAKEALEEAREALQRAEHEAERDIHGPRSEALDHRDLHRIGRAQSAGQIVVDAPGETGPGD